MKKAVKVFDVLFIVGVIVFLMVGYVLPALFDMDNDVTLGMVFLLAILFVYFVARFLVKIISPKNKKGDS
jgi:membrane protease YdiL (CAAX protease family)